jgi:hypothetical protein
MSDNIDLTDPMEVDLLLNKSLACENEFELISVACSVYPQKEPETALSLLVYWLKRKAGNVSIYTGPVTEKSRQRRVGLDWTYAEELVFFYAFRVLASRHKLKPDAKTIATLLQRTEAEVRTKRLTKMEYGVLIYDNTSQSS